MAYSVDLQYTINEDFSGLQTVTESGQPASMTLQGLQSYQTYYTRAVLKNDGVIEDTSNVESFQTLPAGNIVLNHYQTTRSGYAYDVVYTYSSTYAPSWCTLSVNGSTFQGAINSGNNTVSFHVTGLTAGTAYLTSVTMGDIYGEEASIQGSIVTTVVNTISITNIDSGFTSVDVDVEYIIDGGYSTGWVDYWDASGDPSTDQPEGHEVLYNGDETVTVSNLSENTAYKFRATIILADGTTRIDSNVVNASTNVNYATKYFTIENISQSYNAVWMRSDAANVVTVEASTDGVNWTSHTIGTSSTSLGSLQNTGDKLMIRHSGAMYVNNKKTYIETAQDVEVYGNIASLTHGSDFVGTKTMPSQAFRYLFNGCTTLKSVKNLVFDSFNSISDYGCHSMFAGCTGLVDSPKLNATTLSDYSYTSMFSRCSSLTNAPQLPATILGRGCYESMFSGCTALKTAPNLNATTLSDECYSGMFGGCTSLINVPEELPATRLADSCYTSMFLGCTSLESTPKLPAQTLTTWCYANMFKNCMQLEISPDMSHVTSIGTYSLKSMFEIYSMGGCGNLKIVYAPSVSTWDTTNSKDWLNGQCNGGEIYKPANLTIPTNDTSGVPSGWSTEDY